MIFDTDVLIWAQRNHPQAKELVHTTSTRMISLQTYLELLQRAKNKKQQRTIRDFLKYYTFQTLPLTENIGHRAAVYVEEYSLSGGMLAGDALIAATAVENSVTLLSANYKHFKMLTDLDLKAFKPF